MSSWRFIITVASFTVVATATRASAQGQAVPLSEVVQRIKRAVDNGATTTRIGTSVTTNCRAFPMNETTTAQLKKAGADDALIAVIGGACEKIEQAPPPPPPREVPGGIEVPVKIAIVANSKTNPVMDLPVRLVSTSRDTVAVGITNLDGEVIFGSVKPGSYRIVTPEPFQFENKNYRWDYGIVVRSPMRRTDLTGRLARIDTGSVVPPLPTVDAPVIAVSTPEATSSVTIPVAKEPDFSSSGATLPATTAQSARSAVPIDIVNSLLSGSFDVDTYIAAHDPFRVVVMTPQVSAWRAAHIANVAGKADAKTVAGKVDVIETWPSWPTYVKERRAAVIVNVIPDKTGFPEYNPDKVLGFRDAESVSDVKILRDGEEIAPVEKTQLPATLVPDAYKADGDKYVAMQGIAVYRPEDFVRGSNFEVVVKSASGAETRATLEPKLLSLVRKDIEAFLK